MNTNIENSQTPREQPTTVDLKGATKLTGFSRQRLHGFRNDPELNFPEPVVVGRSLRWFVTDLMKWMQSLKMSNAALLATRKTKSKQKTKPSPKVGELKALKVRKPWAIQKTVPLTIAQVEEKNRIASTLRLKPGMYELGSMVTTAEGTTMWLHRVGGTPRDEAQRPSIQAAVYRGRVAKSTAQLKTEPVSTKTQQEPSAKRSTNPKQEAMPVNLLELKAAYESGKSVDAICKQFRMGKSRVLRLLHEAGTQMRSPGRKAA